MQGAKEKFAIKVGDELVDEIKEKHDEAMIRTGDQKTEGEGDELDHRPMLADVHLAASQTGADRKPRYSNYNNTPK